MSNYDDIKTITLHFTKDELDRIAGDTIPIDCILDVSNDHVLKNAFTNIREEIIKTLEHACFRTKKNARITTVVNNNMPLYFKNEKGYRRGLRDNQKLVQALDEFQADPDDQDFVINVDCNGLFYHPSYDPYNFDDVSPDIMDFPMATPSPPVLSTTVATHTSPSPVIPTTATLPPILFMKLPPTVKTRYDAYQAGTFLHYTLLENEYEWEDGTTHKYYENDQNSYQRIFINTGAIFNRPYNSKGFKKDPPICHDESPTGLRRWYDLFRRHCYAYGLFIPPYENIRLGMNHDGFEFGNNIPLHLQEYQDIWRLDLHTILQKVFPDKNSTNRQRVASTTNGYHALLAVIKPSHPLCHESPSSIIGDPPSQESHENVPTFWARFHDQGVLDTVFLNGHFDPSSKHTVDRFIRKCTYGPYLLKATREDRKDPSLLRDFEPSSLPLTLESYLARDDSPTMTSPPSYSKPYSAPIKPRDSYSANKTRESFRPYVKKVQALTAASDTDLPLSASDLEDVIVQQLQQTDKRACLFCGEPHTFDQCRAFSDKKWVDNFLIKIVSTVKGKLREAHRIQNGEAIKSQEARMNQIAQETVDAVLKPDVLDSSIKPSPDTDDTTKPSSDFR